MSEAAPGKPTTYDLPIEARHISWLRYATIGLWVTAVILGILDITDDFPRGLITVTGVATGSATLGAIILRVGYGAQIRLAKVLDAVEQGRGRAEQRDGALVRVIMSNQRQLVDALAALVVEQRRLSAALDDLAAGLPNDLLPVLVVRLDAVERLMSDLTAQQDRETGALGVRIDEAIALAYRRGLVNGAQQIVPDNGRPPLRSVGESDSS